ncbi:unnamed protein product [Effrenium voratum]|uniref:Uncharacterized protein n=1 Tax=Effrenium voratum TaxID=2562239 RepID=A0AA36JLQ9_9DINO|nr:unnamed protein product [Effrenium voratum]CAJ1412411.1 unnamed protein product [Effrenium voratum]
MKDDVAEMRYAAVRAKLSEHCYHQHFDAESVLLVETMIDDLIASAAGFKEMEQKEKERTQELQLLISELGVLRLENPRLQAENNGLHLQIIEAVEASETWEASMLSSLQSLEEEMESTKLQLQREVRHNCQSERRLQQAQLLALDAAGLADAEEPCEAPRRAALMPRDDEPQELALSEALGRCQARLVQLEAQAAAARRRGEDMESQAADLCDQLFKPCPQLRQRALQAGRTQSLERSRADVQEMSQQHAELESRLAAVEGWQKALEHRNTELKSEAKALLVSVDEESAKTTEVLENSRAQADIQKRLHTEMQERSESLQQMCRRIEGSTKILNARLAQISREEVLKTTEQSRQVKELLDKLVLLQEGHQQSPLTSQLKQIEERLHRAEDESSALSTSRSALQEEVQSAMLEAETQARQLTKQTQALEGDIRNDADIQSRWHGADTHLQWLNASLSGITDEQKKLATYLQEQQTFLQQESMQRVQLHAEVQRLHAVVRSLDGTREEWLADLGKAVDSLRQSHASLTATLQQEEFAQATSDKLRQEAFQVQRSIQVASTQRDELSAEVQEWGQELHSDLLRRDEARSMAARLVEELRELQLSGTWTPERAPDPPDAESLDQCHQEVWQLEERLARVETRTASVISKATLSEAANLQQLGFEGSCALEKVCEGELASAEAMSEAVSSKCWQLQADIQEMLASASIEESAHDQLESEFARCQHGLSEMEMSEHHAAAGWGDEQRAAASELDLLRKAAAILDEERDITQRLADDRAQEVDDLQNAIRDHQQSLQEAQQALDDLRSSADGQQHHLDQQRLMKTDRQEHLEALRHQSQALRVDVRERSTEVSHVLEDLQHMVKENQDLHEESRKLALSVTARTAEARKKFEQQEESAEQLHALELERVDVARLREQICLQTRQQEVAISRLSNHKETARRAAGELVAQLQRIQGAQESWHSREEEYQVDISLMQEQIADIAQRVAMSEESQQKALEEDARLQGDVAAAAKAAEGADQSEAAQAQAVASLRLRRHQIEVALQQTMAEVASQQRLAEQDWSQVSRLESLLESGQIKLNKSTAELEALQKYHRSSPLAVGSDAAASPSSLSLKQQENERYAKVGELDAQRQRLHAEVTRLRAELKRRSG